jgi:SAM-dependent methyltransferase
LKHYIQRALSIIGVKKKFTPKPGSVWLGDLHRTSPFSRRYGIDRGGAVDRIFIENFLNENKSYIKGRVLEVSNNEYTIRYGGSNVVKSDVLHVNDTNPKATIIADLSKPLDIEENLFDCIIFTQTLQFIFDFKKTIENLYRLLKPGGYLLLTVPGITPIGKDPFDWFWSFTTCSMQTIMSEQFNSNNIEIKSFGNVLVASAFLYGMGRNELKSKDLIINDPSYQVIITVSAKK